MKRRRDDREPSENFRKVTRVGNAGTPFKTKQKKLGGGGLSLEAFAAAKSKPLINPAQIREHREFYQNAKKVQKYKKLVRQLGEQGRGSQSTVENLAAKPITNQDSQSPNDDNTHKKSSPRFVRKTDGKQFKTHRKNKKQQNNSSQLERIREEQEKEKLDKEERRKERDKLYAEQQESREKTQRVRKEVKARLRKKTQRGQPVMKHRMEQLLENIQRGSN